MLNQNIDQVNVGNIVQVNSSFIDRRWKHCLVVVDEVKKWGIWGHSIIPGQGIGYIRLDYKDIELVGECKWVIDNLEVVEEISFKVWWDDLTKNNINGISKKDIACMAFTAGYVRVRDKE